MKQKVGQLLLLASLSTLVVQTSAKRNGLLNKRSAIDDYMEFHGPMFPTEYDPPHSFNIQQTPSEPVLKAEHKTSASPRVGQEDTYEGYRVRKEPFSSTDTYQYALQFKIGAKLDQNYQYVDECFDAWVHIFDDAAYYANNVTDVQDAIEANVTNNWWFNYLNLTGIMFGPVADIMVECYRFGNSVYEYEDARFIQFNQDWGDFFLAFLFNQMGNALYFQAKFERIQDFKAKQSFQSIWLEYGDLLYLIWDFDPLPESSYDSIEDYINVFAEQFAALDTEHNEMHRVLASHGVPLAARALKQYSRQLDTSIKTSGKRVSAYFEELREKREAKKAFTAAENLETFTWADPWTTPEFLVGTITDSDIIDLLYGMVNGAIDVFPYSSNPNRCRNNITQTYTAIINWVNWDYDIVNSEDDRLTFFKEMSYVVQLPFGVCYSCYWGFSTLLLNHDPMEDGVITEQERLEELLMLGHDIPTNLFYNVGYIYGDIWTMYGLNDGINKYWEKFGQYLGDATIRIFWRRQFTRNFDYDIEDDDD